MPIVKIRKALKMGNTIGNYSIESQKCYEVLKSVGATSAELKSLDVNNDMKLSEDELVEISSLIDESDENSTTSSNGATTSIEEAYEKKILALQIQLDNALEERRQLISQAGTAEDSDESSSINSELQSLNSNIQSIRNQIYQAYYSAEVQAANGSTISSGAVAASDSSAVDGSYTYSGNNEDFVNTFNNSSFNQGVLAGKGAMVASIAEKYGLDPNLLASIMALETGWGTSSAIKNYNNPGGMMDPASNWMSLKHYSSLAEGIEAVAKNLKTGYIDQGLTTISSIGAKYCPVGAANDPNGTNSGWVPSVTKIYNMLTGANITANTKIG